MSPGPSLPVRKAHSVAQQTEAVIELNIYVVDHCMSCEYAHEVAEGIRRDFPEVELKLINMATTSETIPESVFATPTYLLNGRVWSLGNPSQDMVADTFGSLTGRSGRS